MRGCFLEFLSFFRCCCGGGGGGIERERGSFVFPAPAGKRERARGAIICFLSLFSSDCNARERERETEKIFESLFVASGGRDSCGRGGRWRRREGKKREQRKRPSLPLSLSLSPTSLPSPSAPRVSPRLDSSRLHFLIEPKRNSSALGILFYFGPLRAQQRGTAVGRRRGG